MPDLLFYAVKFTTFYGKNQPIFSELLNITGICAPHLKRPVAVV